MAETLASSSLPTLEAYLQSLKTSDAYSSLLDSVLPSLLSAISDIGKALKTSQEIALVGTSNVFGDEQLNVDVLAENIVREAIAKCPTIVTGSSEEDPVERPSRPGEQPTVSQSDQQQYTIAFDPLDGSSIIASNWTVGTIIGIWEGISALGQSPAEKQIAAILGVLGPRTTAIVALRIPGDAPACFEVGIGDGGISTHSIVRSSVQLAKPPFKTRYFAPANLRAAADDSRYLNLVNHFIREKYTLRYSGGLVPDVVHALVKGNGVYISPVTGSSKAKLRRLYELYPVALIIECAGGRAVDPTDGQRILERVLQHCDERAGLLCGTAEEVEVAKTALLE
ncbi:hypothetical protein G7046_g3580 [Stylonectria norvegica]|nr:hypothetical protein G7046_g3580 [Stylonectria norvegica]